MAAVAAAAGWQQNEMKEHTFLKSLHLKKSNSDTKYEHPELVKFVISVSQVSRFVMFFCSTQNCSTH
jgi:hypothetical protein